MSKHKFEVDAPDAKQVFVAGDFNEWEMEAIPLKKKRGKNGCFAAELQLEPGRYEYKFVIDGEWHCHPEGETVPNPFGTLNSVCLVPPSPSGKEAGPQAANA